MSTTQTGPIAKAVMTAIKRYNPEFHLDFELDHKWVDLYKKEAGREFSSAQWLALCSLTDDFTDGCNMRYLATISVEEQRRRIEFAADYSLKYE